MLTRTLYIVWNGPFPISDAITTLFSGAINGRLMYALLGWPAAYGLYSPKYAAVLWVDSISNPWAEIFRYRNADIKTDRYI